jgi:hypothetical protein
MHPPDAMRRTTTRPEERKDRDRGPPAATATDPKAGWPFQQVSKALRSAGSFLGPEKSRNRQTDCRRERERVREKRRRERES